MNPLIEILMDALLAEEPRAARMLLPELGLVDAGIDACGLWGELEVGGVRQRLRWIQPGTYLRGSPEDEADRWADEGPQHPVFISRGFWLGDTPVTQALWKAVTGETPSFFEGPTRPVECVSWDEAQAFCAALGQHCPNLAARLPTEAEWEYACRAGTTGPHWLANEDGDLGEIAWYADNSERQTQPVGRLAPNPWGLYDMLGNVWEWCQDAWSRYEPEPAEESDGRHRLIRGGSWDDRARNVRAAARGRSVPGYLDDDIGLRIAVDPIEEGSDEDEDGGGRVIRGGFWDGHARNARAAFRNRIDPGGRHDSIGFRVAVDPIEEGSDEGDRLRVIRGGAWGSHARSVRAAYRLHDEPGDRDLILGLRLVVDPDDRDTV